ncbi:MAG: bifunctional ornithine acetyltransferase/N-acetylglutamate synthase [Clostridiales bacterium GWF2_38_85]|nr:MAG: bifunctional ornithine acetyltransferase/N-acetylglutamate synthase [Clostridiales bacterium GWF2_38_85]HBL84265.1 arginine biosynthesis protein ArgJ [Clostridiales bacterium]
MAFKFIDGGVCAAKGYKASGIHCGIRKNKSKRDLALIVSECRATAAAIYTLNLVKGAPIYVTKANIADGFAQAVICNSGNANTCNANGIEIAEAMCELVAKHTDIKANDVIVASTGVIAQPLSVEPIANGMQQLVDSLAVDSKVAAEAIMTTDTKLKEVAVSFKIDGKECRIGGIAKGSGMIHPNMATMLVFLTSDVAISAEMLKTALKEVTDDTFNMISIDGDTSTNDMVSLMANGLAGNAEITEKNSAYKAFKKALYEVTVKLCKMIAADGEGATKLLECKVSGAKTTKAAKVSAKSVICSSLLKAAMFGADANCGRVLCALGYSGADIDVTKVDVSLESEAGRVDVCKNGVGILFSEEDAKKVLLCSEIVIDIALNDGKKSATAWGCDLTYDYVKINGDYRT